jgi:triosephosphate isomerase
MRKKIVAGNWKMNLKYQDAITLTTEIVQMKAATSEEVELILFPAFPYLQAVKKQLGNVDIKVGAQNVNAEQRGAYTGEVSTEMLVSIGATHVLLGHSERRAYHLEGGEMLKAKVDRVLHEGMVVVYCCGESLAEREAGKHFEVVQRQLQEALFHVSPTFMKNVVIAYEPVWAIGTGKTATAEEAQEIHEFIRGAVKRQFDEKIANELSILYGGSCKPDNAESLFAKPDIDGGLIGGAALVASDFITISSSFK